MAQFVRKALAAKFKDLSLIPETCTVEIQTTPESYPLTSPLAPHTYTQEMYSSFCSKEKAGV